MGLNLVRRVLEDEDNNKLTSALIHKLTNHIHDMRVLCTHFINDYCVFLFHGNSLHSNIK